MIGSAAARLRRMSLEEWLAALFCFTSLTVVVYLLSDYSINWSHPEMYLNRVRNTLVFTRIGWHDLARFFDCYLVDKCNRVRFLSYFMFYLNSVFRVWLLQYIPPHPSLSLTWILTFASVYFLNRTIFILTRDRTAAMLAAGLYALSMGFLSMLVMLFNPAKPLAGFFVNFCLYLAARLWRAGENRAYSATAILLYVSLFLAYCSDETAFLLYGAVPVLFPELFRRRRLALASCFLFTFPLFLVFVTWLAPIATRYFWGHQDLDFWGWALNIGRRLPEDSNVPLFARLDASKLLQTAYNMLLSEFAWPKVGSLGAAVSLLPLVLGVAAAVALGTPPMRVRLARALVLLTMFVLFEGLVMLRLGGAGYAAESTFYYGSLFPNVAFLVLGIAISCFRGMPGARISCVVASFYFAWVSYSQFVVMNREWMSGHEAIYASYVQKNGQGPYGPLTRGAPLTEAKSARYWRAVMAGDDPRGLRASFSPKDAWLFEEVDARFCSARACCLWQERLKEY